MRYLELTLDTATENVALDEALLESAQRAAPPGSGEQATDGAVTAGPPEGEEVLRLWESRQPLVVVGRSSRIGEEVNLDECRRLGVPVLRRASGGAAIVAGPGCLMYAVVLRIADKPFLEWIDKTHDFVLGHLVRALRSLQIEAQVRGFSDLTLGDSKISGNSLRKARTHVLYHGTLLYDFDLNLISRLLLEPPRQPAYRERRKHQQFVVNLACSCEHLRIAIRQAWQADEPLTDWPVTWMRHLVETRYSQEEWNFSR